MKVTRTATFSEYTSGNHITDGTFVSRNGHGSVSESLSIFTFMLDDLAKQGLQTGTPLQITIKTLPKGKH
jgi:hypothetical protein